MSESKFIYIPSADIAEINRMKIMPKNKNEIVHKRKTKSEIDKNYYYHDPIKMLILTNKKMGSK